MNCMILSISVREFFVKSDHDNFPKFEFDSNGRCDFPLIAFFAGSVSHY